METIAFFLSTLSLAVTSSSNTPALFKQFLCVVLGLALLLGAGGLPAQPDWAKKIRWLMAAGAIGLLSLTVVLYLLGLTGTKYGAANWLTIAGISVQPSELAKICYIFAGAATLDRLFRKRNLGLFILLTGVCLACLAYMSDFGTAAIFFVTFLVIAYLRSGDWATLALICGGGVFAVLTMLSLKPYILQRFATWGHAWQNASVGSGYQQTRTMSAAASGGLVGVGPGEGWLHTVGAGDTDLVFGMLCEEWGLIIALLAVLSILTLAVFAVRACRAGRSSFYVIAACAATSMMVFQTCLNVFGAVDILPLTGVTFPFVSNGGTAMIASWGLLASSRPPTPGRTPALPSARPPGGRTAGGRRWPPNPPTNGRRTMKKIEKRALLCLLLAAALLLGSGLFVFRFVKNGGRWVSFAANRHLYNRQGQLSVGRVLTGTGTCSPGRRGRHPALVRQRHRAQGHPPRRGGRPGQHRHRGAGGLCRPALRLQPAHWAYHLGRGNDLYPHPGRPVQLHRL